MLQRNDLITLTKLAANANPSAPVAYSFGEEKFSYADLCETVRSEFKELAGTYALYRENKNTIFTIMEEVVEDVLPKRVLEQYGQLRFAEIGPSVRQVHRRPHQLVHPAQPSPFLEERKRWRQECRLCYHVQSACGFLQDSRSVPPASR